MKKILLPISLEDSCNEFKITIDEEISNSILNTVIAMNNSNNSDTECNIWLFIDDNGYYDDEFYVSNKEHDTLINNLIYKINDKYNIHLKLSNNIHYIKLSFYPLDEIIMLDKKDSSKGTYYRNGSTNKFVKNISDTNIMNQMKRMKNLPVFPNERNLIKIKYDKSKFQNLVLLINQFKNTTYSDLNLLGLFDVKTRYLTIEGLIFHDEYMFYQVSFNNEKVKKINFFELKEEFFKLCNEWLDSYCYINESMKIIIRDQFNKDGLLDEVLRELFYNSITHMDFNSDSPIKIKFFKNSFSISNPINPIILQEGNNILDCLRRNNLPIHHPYNINTYTTFRHLNLVESQGQGFKTINKFLKENNNIYFKFDLSNRHVFNVSLIIDNKKPNSKKPNDIYILPK